MSRNNRPAEVFGYPIGSRTLDAVAARTRHWCPFADRACIKQSRLLDYPFGVCSIEHRGGVCTTCPVRFLEVGSHTGVPRVLEDVALHYFGDFNNVIPFAEIRLPLIGSIDYVLVRHKPMKAKVDDFVAVEFQADSTTGTGEIVRALREHMAGEDITQRSYAFGLNTYDTIKRSMTQLFNKGIVYESWNVKGYWVIQEYIYANLVRRYGLKTTGFYPSDATRFALYDFERSSDALRLGTPRYLSTTVDEVYQAMRHNAGLLNKDQFVATLNSKLKAQLQLHLD